MAEDEPRNYPNTPKELAKDELMHPDCTIAEIEGNSLDENNKFNFGVVQEQMRIEAAANDKRLGDYNEEGTHPSRESMLITYTEFNGSLNFSLLKSTGGLDSFKNVHVLDLNGLTTAKELVLPERFEGWLDLSGLKSAEELVLPKYVRGVLDLRGLATTKELVLPKYFRGRLILSGLASAEELVLPERFEGRLELNGLTNSEGLVFPERFEGELNLNGLTSAEELVLPKKVRFLNLNCLTSAKGLVFPETITDSLYLNGLTSTLGLELPKNLGHLHLSGLTSDNRELLREKYPSFKIYPVDKN